jgi:hypothetical protein
MVLPAECVCGQIRTHVASTEQQTPVPTHPYPTKHLTLFWLTLPTCTLLLSIGLLLVKNRLARLVAGCYDSYTPLAVIGSLQWQEEDATNQPDS